MMKYIGKVVTLEYRAEKCIGCGMCATVCPRGVFEMEVLGGKSRAFIADNDSCIECGACRMNCPVNAIEVRSGVGCATGLINRLLGVKGECCCSEERVSDCEADIAQDMVTGQAE